MAPTGPATCDDIAQALFSARNKAADQESIAVGRVRRRTLMVRLPLGIRIDGYCASSYFSDNDVQEVQQQATEGQ